MTAEVALLNKTAVALAADSAVTISAGSNQEKVYDSEDKLFELSHHNPIGIMVNNNMHFMEVPLAVLIRRYRETCPAFGTVSEAADHFFSYLAVFAAQSPDEVLRRQLVTTIDPVFKFIEKRVRDKLYERLFEGAAEPPPNDLSQVRQEIELEQLRAFKAFLELRSDTDGHGDATRPELIGEVYTSLIDVHFPGASDATKELLYHIANLTLSKRVADFSPTTGIIFAGFGSSELFPKLVSFEMYAVVAGRTRYFQTNKVDIDRQGDRARVIPFAQREMVERFLYGLDDTIERNITDFCRRSLPSIREAALERIAGSDEDRAEFSAGLEAAETAFIEGLSEQTFQAIRAQSQLAIEDMVEFMPKPEMARMAEALVNLTSMKRRISRGIETVGGPIDCAVISLAEGFVWVKRKHYFPAELNARFFTRIEKSLAGEAG